MDLLEDPEEDREDTVEVNVNTSRQVTGSGRTDMRGGVRNPPLSKSADVGGFRGEEVVVLVAEGI